MTAGGFPDSGNSLEIAWNARAISSDTGRAARLGAYFSRFREWLQRSGLNDSFPERYLRKICFMTLPLHYSQHHGFCG